MINRFSLTKIDKIKLLIAHLIFPNTCLICNSPVEYDVSICEECAKTVHLNNGLFCPLCDNEYHSDKCKCPLIVISPFLYGEGIERSVWALKFDGARLNGRKFGYHIALGVKNAYNGKIDVVTPIPMYKSDEYKRGYNQSAIIARDIGMRINAVVNTNLLIKIKHTDKQHTLDKKHRKSNLKGSFAIKDSTLVKDKTFLLVDDVLTTGATIETARDLLLSHGAKMVICAVGAVVKKRKSETQ